MTDIFIVCFIVNCLSAELSPNQPALSQEKAMVCLSFLWCSFSRRSVTDPRDGRKVALKKMPNVFQNLVSCKRVFRELRMLCFFKHDNVMTGQWGRVMFVDRIKDLMLFSCLCPCRFCQLWTFCSLHRSTALRKCILSSCDLIRVQNQPLVCCLLSSCQQALLLPASHLRPHTFCPSFSSWLSSSCPPFNSLNLAASLRSKSSTSLQMWGWPSVNVFVLLTLVQQPEMRPVLRDASCLCGWRSVRVQSPFFPLTPTAPQLRDNRTDAERPPQSDRVSSASHNRPHQGLPLPDPPRWVASVGWCLWLLIAWEITWSLGTTGNHAVGINIYSWETSLCGAPATSL